MEAVRHRLRLPQPHLGQHSEEISKKATQGEHCLSESGCDHYFEMGRLAATLILILYASSVFASFRTYPQWRAISLEARAAYIAGAIDSWLFSNPEARQHYGDCISNAKIPDVQLALNLGAFLESRPDLQSGAVQNGHCARIWDANEWLSIDGDVFAYPLSLCTL
jgi:hypothetical protein